jgi:hypothetical protein
MKRLLVAGLMAAAGIDATSVVRENREVAVSLKTPTVRLKTWVFYNAQCEVSCPVVTSPRGNRTHLAGSYLSTGCCRISGVNLLGGAAGVGSDRCVHGIAHNAPSKR